MARRRRPCATLAMRFDAFTVPDFALTWDQSSYTYSYLDDGCIFAPARFVNCLRLA